MVQTSFSKLKQLNGLQSRYCNDSVYNGGGQCYMSIGFEKAYALQTDLNMSTSEIIATYVYKKGILDGDYGFSTAVGLFNTVINIILLISMNAIAKKNE